MQIVKAALLALPALLALACGCKARVTWSRYHYGNHRYSIEHPSDWKPFESPGIQMVMAPHLQIHRGIPLGSMTITRSRGGPSLEEALREEADRVADPLFGGRIESREETNVADLPARVLVLHQPPMKGLKGAKAYRHLLFLVQRKPSIWRLDCMVEASRFARDRAVCERMARSLRFDREER